MKQINKIALFLCHLTSSAVFSQNIAVNTTGAAANSAALFDVGTAAGGDTKGILIPRVALTSTALWAPVTPAGGVTSMLVYNTNTAGDVTPGYYYWDGAKWVPFLKGGSGGTGWLTTGNLGTTAGTNYIGTNDVQDFVIKTSAVVNTPLERMRVTTAGNVGIGISSPSNTLHIYVNSTSDPLVGGLKGITVSNGDLTTNSLSGILFQGYDDGGTGRHGGAIVAGKELNWVAGSGAYPGFLSFWTRQSGSNEFERMRITSTGNVGIGTSAPSLNTGTGTVLHVNNANASYASIAHFTNGTSGAAGSNGLITGLWTDNNAYLWNYSNTPLIFGTNGVERMRIAAGGNVGIGTNNPTYLVDVQGGYLNNSATSGSPYIRTSGDNDLYFDGGSDGIFWLTNEGIAGGRTSIRSGGTERFTVLNSGNVGIGCLNPSQALYVTGNIYATGTILASQAACSDERWKQDFTRLENSLNKILKLSSYYYKFNIADFPDKSFPAQRQLGMKAQDVENVFPELVYTDKEGYKYLDYSRLSPILLEAIKELNTMIMNLQAENEKLNSANNKLQAEFNDRFRKLEEILGTKATR